MALALAVVPVEVVDRSNEMARALGASTGWIGGICKSSPTTVTAAPSSSAAKATTACDTGIWDASSTSMKSKRPAICVRRPSSNRSWATRAFELVRRRRDDRDGAAILQAGPQRTHGLVVVGRHDAVAQLGRDRGGIGPAGGKPGEARVEYVDPLQYLRQLTRDGLDGDPGGTRDGEAQARASGDRVRQQGADDLDYGEGLAGSGRAPEQAEPLAYRLCHSSALARGQVLADPRDLGEADRDVATRRLSGERVGVPDEPAIGGSCLSSRGLDILRRVSTALRNSGRSAEILGALIARSTFRRRGPTKKSTTRGSRIA